MSKPMKTNAMRQLDAAKIPYTPCTYEVDESDLSGVHIADQIGLPYEQVFKTIVTRGDKTGCLVFCIPCHKEIDLKRAAALTGNKKIEPVPVKELLGLTGYIRGGCSPVGMKKKLPTYFDQSAAELCELTVSAGVRGIQLLLKREDILSFTGAVLGDLTVK
ncbi:MAG: Cys-tRNA(Pro) deacylase [Clostridia bacterium]|nr:Cys-tRNA(Pro) deacylase [Clostridia bacterium]